MFRHRSVSFIVIVKNTAMRHSLAFPQCDSTAGPVGGCVVGSRRAVAAARRLPHRPRHPSLKLEVWWRNAAGDTETQGPTVAAAAACVDLCVCVCVMVCMCDWISVRVCMRHCLCIACEFPKFLTPVFCPQGLWETGIPVPR